MRHICCYMMTFGTVILWQSTEFRGKSIYGVIEFGPHEPSRTPAKQQHTELQSESRSLGDHVIRQ